MKLLNTFHVLVSCGHYIVLTVRTHYMHLQHQKTWGPFLIVSPASTLHNWQQECTRFVPRFKVLSADTCNMHDMYRMPCMVACNLHVYMHVDVFALKVEIVAISIKLSVVVSTTTLKAKCVSHYAPCMQRS